jgi:FkbM family methyltransferase
MSLLQANISGYLAQATPIEREIGRLLVGHRRPLILDIGACEGEDSIRYARRFSGGKVIAFEPLPGNQALIRANFARYAATNAELVPLALSDRTGQATFHVSSGRPPELFAGTDWNYGNKSSSLLPPAAPGAMHGCIEFKEAITVKTETLDSFCLARNVGRIDFIHMDVQGAEQLVLSGTSAMLPRTTAIWLEVASRPLYRDQALAPEIAQFMRARGFILAHANYLGDSTGEGDHLYVNRRCLRSWVYLAGQLSERLLNRIRRIFGRKPTPV